MHPPPCTFAGASPVGGQRDARSGGDGSASCTSTRRGSGATRRCARGDSGGHGCGGRRHRRHSGPMLIRTMILATCTTVAVAIPCAVAGEGWSDDEVLAVAGALAKQLAMPDDKRDTAKSRLSSVLHDPRWRAKYAGLPVRGVFAYQMGEGGLIVKVKKGKGLLSSVPQGLSHWCVVGRVGERWRRQVDDHRRSLTTEGRHQAAEIRFAGRRHWLGRADVKRLRSALLRVVRSQTTVLEPRIPRARRGNLRACATRDRGARERRSVRPGARARRGRRRNTPCGRRC